MKLIITFILTITFSVSLVYSQISERKFVSINNKKMAYKTFGLEIEK
ncbi:hypothetical protein OKW96_18110 [Sphingobacterium sp. KU25419]|nr:hypothetical protein OKW96_18110 [Sphingobacterium sp. KU25419]